MQSRFIAKHDGGLDALYEVVDAYRESPFTTLSKCAFINLQDILVVQDGLIMGNFTLLKIYIKSVDSCSGCRLNTMHLGSPRKCTYKL